VLKAQAVHWEVLGETPELVAMHAGLECLDDGSWTTRTDPEV